MKKSLITLTAIAAALFTSQMAVAQDKARADVKAEAKDAVKAGKVEKGEGSASPTAGAKSTKERAEVKKEAAAAEKAGTIEKGPSPAPTGKSVKSRAEVKKEAASAVKSGDVAKGEGPAKK